MKELGMQPSEFDKLTYKDVIIFAELLKSYGEEMKNYGQRI